MQLQRQIFWTSLTFCDVTASHVKYFQCFDIDVCMKGHLGEITHRTEYTILDALIAKDKPTAFVYLCVCLCLCVPAHFLSVCQNFLPSFKHMVTTCFFTCCKRWLDEFWVSDLVTHFHKLITPELKMDI